MKNYIKYPILVLIIIIGFGSCKKGFLDEAGVTSPLFRENYVRDLNSMEEYLNGIYVDFIYNWSGFFYKGYPEYVADNLKPVNENDPDIIANYKWSQNPFGGVDPDYYLTNMSRDWVNNYRIIRESSFVIEDINKYRKENPIKADYIKGQALFFRAIMHYKLVNIFAQPYGFTAQASHLGVPYITSSNLSEPYSRQTVKQVYEGIVADLKQAIDLMAGTTTTDLRYIGSDAAKGLLARVYLFQGDYANAINLAKEVCAKHPLMSIGAGYPNGLYYKLTGPSEVLFQVTPASNPDFSRFLGTFMTGALHWYYATRDIADVLKENSTDIRSSWVSSDNGNWKVTKFPLGVAGIRGTLAADYYDPVVRSSEMFLTVAEAAFKTGDEDVAREYLNAVRKRADPSRPDIVAGGEQLINTIYKERRKELCFENLRLFDLQRLGMSINRADVLPGSPKTLSYPSDKAIAPIPQKDVNISGLKQNEGY